MKPTRVMLTAASTLLVSQVMAGEAVFYITEDGMSMRDVAVSVDGNKQLIGNTGFVSFDIDSGTHSVEISKYGEWLGDFKFATENGNQNAEIQVEVLGGEALEDVVVYTPGQEEAPALGQVSGYLNSEETGGAVAGASVSIAGTDNAVMTDEDGFFSFELPRGEYQLAIAHPNYGQRDVSGVRVMANVNTGVNLTMGMSGNGVIEEVVAVGSYIPSTATAQERDSSAVLDAIGSEQMSRFGDSSAASALKRVAGVAVAGGQFAIIRGMAGRYISSTLNGSLMPSTDPMRRDVPLDLFPASVLGGIDIQKSFTPDMPGDSTGGAIRMTTKGFPDATEGKLKVSLGVNDRTTFNDVISYQGGETDWLGMDDGTREVPSRAESATNGGLDNIEVSQRADDYEAQLASRVAMSQSFENNWDTQQSSAKPIKGLSLSLSDFDEKDYGNQGMYFAASYSDATTARHEAKLDTLSGEGSYQRSKRNIDLSGYFMYGLELDSVELTSQTIVLRKTDNTTKQSYIEDEDLNQIRQSTLLQWVERQMLSQQFNGLHYIDGLGEDELNWHIGLAQTSRYEPDRRTYTYSKTIGTDNPLRLVGNPERRYAELDETSLDIGLDYSSIMDFDSYTFKGKAGVAYNSKDRDVDLQRYGAIRNDTSLDTSASMEDVYSAENVASSAVYYRGTTADSDSYGATDDVRAMYVSGEFDFYDYSVLAGVRRESIKQVLSYPNIDGAEDSKLEESYMLPVVSGNWRVTEDAQLRASLSKTISRPGITERSESQQYDPETDDILEGNPDLEISKIKNLDLRGEYYFSDEESITVALFYKDIDKPIERSVREGDGSAADGYTYANVPTAELKGLEFDFRVNTFDTLDYTSFVSGNFAYVDSEVDLSGTDAERLEGLSNRPLQGQSKYLGNLQLGLDHLNSGQSVTLLFNYYDDRIYATTRGANVDALVEDGRLTMDLTYSWDASDVLSVKAKLSNLTDSKVSYSQGDRENESYFEGRSLSASAEYIF